MEGGVGDDGVSAEVVSVLASLGFLLVGLGARIVIGPVCFRAKRGREGVERGRGERGREERVKGERERE